MNVPWKPVIKTHEQWAAHLISTTWMLPTMDFIIKKLGLLRLPTGWLAPIVSQKMSVVESKNCLCFIKWWVRLARFNSFFLVDHNCHHYHCRKFVLIMVCLLLKSENDVPLKNKPCLTLYNSIYNQYVYLTSTNNGCVWKYGGHLSQTQRVPWFFFRWKMMKIFAVGLPQHQALALLEMAAKEEAKPSKQLRNDWVFCWEMETVTTKNIEELGFD